MEMKQTEATTSVMGVAQWHERAGNGQSIPLYIPINGVSMYPLIRRNRDRVLIMPVRKEELRIGDIVLFSDPYAERYVLHRLIEMNGNRVLTRGDNCVAADAPMDVECIWGRAELIHRGRQEIRPDPIKGMRLAKMWYRAGRDYRFALRVRGKIWRIIRGVTGI